MTNCTVFSFLFPMQNIEMVFAVCTSDILLFLDCRNPLPDDLKSILEEGISLYKLHTSRHGRLVACSSIHGYYCYCLTVRPPVIYQYQRKNGKGKTK